MKREMTLQRSSDGDRAWTKGSNVRNVGTICSRGGYCPFPAVATAHIADGAAPAEATGTGGGEHGHRFMMGVEGKSGDFLQKNT